jgi:hypothetical protein
MLFVNAELWMLTEHGLLGYDPASNEPSFASAIPWQLTAGIRVGDRLWIAAKPKPESSHSPPDYAAADSCLLAFNLTSRTWERQIALQSSGSVAAMAYHDGRLWLGLGGKNATVAVVDATIGENAR